MAGKTTGNKTGQDKDRRPYFEQPWVECVLEGTYSAFEKLLFVRMASFGKAGCWMPNETLMRKTNHSRTQVKGAITKLWEGGELIITGWNNQSRTIYAARNPEVLAEMNVRYENERAKGKVKDKDDYQGIKRFRGFGTGKNHIIEGAGKPTGGGR